MEFYPENKLFLFNQQEKDVKFLAFSFKWNNRIIQCLRRCDEPWTRAQRRLVSKLVEVSDRKLRKRKKSGEGGDHIEVPVCEFKFPANIVNAIGAKKAEEWRQQLGSDVLSDKAPLVGDILKLPPGTKLQIGSCQLDLVQDPRWISTLKLALRPTAELPILPSVTVEAGDEENLRILWFVEKDLEGSDMPSIQPTDTPVISRGRLTVDENASGQREISITGYEMRTEGWVFVPRADDAGKQIRVVVDLGPDTIVRAGTTEEWVKVHPKADTYIWEDRQSKYCQKWLKGSSFRLMSYNILADMYLDLTLKTDQLYFPYCPRKFQEYQYRYPMIMKEIAGYKADIFCLQEVDYRFYYRFLQHYMPAIDYSVEFCIKGRAVNEGLAICYRRDRIRLLENHDIFLVDLLNTEKYPENQDLFDFASQHQDFHQLLTTRATFLQLTCLENQEPNQEPRIFLVGNTHLHFHPRHGHIKILQTELCVRHMRNIWRLYREKYPDHKLHLIFAGDLNSHPQSGVYEYLEKGRLNASHPDWQGQVDLQAEEGAQDFDSGLELTAASELGLKNAAGTPEYTNYCRKDDGSGFKGCLDYIWISQNIGCRAEPIPMPDHQLVAMHQALPSKIGPSDHLAILADIEFLD